MTSTATDAQHLEQRLNSYHRVLIAFSGGVDSSVVAAAAVRAGLARALAATARSPSVPAWQLEIADRVARELGIEHQIVSTHEGDRHDYQQNNLRRCFYCKETLYDALQSIAETAQLTIVSGTNADDLGDYRPGIQAGQIASVKTPLADLGLGKPAVRGLARHYQLSNAELPASPCLASRIAYGIAVTPTRLGRIEAAEQWLREQNFSDVRVRLHDGELARVEVPLPELPRLVETELCQRLDKYLRQLGFQFVTIDTGGLRSGSLNPDVVSLDTITNPESLSGRREPGRLAAHPAPTPPALRGRGTG